MLHRGVECLQSLSCKGSAAPVADRGGDDYRKVASHLLHRVDGSLGDQGVKAGFQLDNVHSTSLQGRNLLCIYLHHIVEGILAECQVRCVRRKGQRLPGRAHAARHIHRAGGCIRSLARDARRAVRHFGGLPRPAVLLLANAVGPETVGLYYVRPCGDEFLVNGPDQLRIVQVQRLVVAYKMPLDHSAHCTVQYQYPVFQILGKRHRPRNYLSECPRCCPPCP